jgi:hypothetical protein
MKNYVIQRLVSTHQINAGSRLGTWRTVTSPTAENEAVRQLLRMSRLAQHRALSSPSTAEMQLGAEVTEWTL